MSSLISPALAATLEAAAQNVFDTFKRPFTLYLTPEATAVVSTNPNYSRFGQNDQNTFTPGVAVPQVYTVTGCVLYGNKQPWEYIEPQQRSTYHQDKLRNSQGQVRIKVDQYGYGLMAGCKRLVLDGFNFQLTSSPRPHGVIGTPVRWTFVFDSLE